MSWGRQGCDRQGNCFVAKRGHVWERVVPPLLGNRAAERAAEQWARDVPSSGKRCPLALPAIQDGSAQFRLGHSHNARAHCARDPSADQLV